MSRPTVSVLARVVCVLSPFLVVLLFLIHPPLEPSAARPGGGTGGHPQKRRMWPASLCVGESHT
jgi:hypothetical protein